MKVIRQQLIKALLAARQITDVVYVEGAESDDSLRVEAHKGDGRDWRSIGMRVRVDSVEGSGRVGQGQYEVFGAWVDAGQLLKVLRGAKAGEVEITGDKPAWSAGSGLKLNIGGKAKVSILAADPPNRDDVRGWKSPVRVRPPKYQEVEVDGLLEMLNEVAYARKPKYEQRGLDGILLTIPMASDSGGEVACVASDGHRLAWTWRPGQRSSIPKRCEWYQVVLPWLVGEVVLKMGAMTGGKGDGKVSVELGGEGQELRVRVELGEDRWVVGEVGRRPTLGKAKAALIDKTLGGDECIVNRVELLDALKALAPFAPGTKKTTEWGFQPGTLTIAAKDEDGNVGGRWLDLEKGRSELITRLSSRQVMDWLKRVSTEQVLMRQDGDLGMVRFEPVDAKDGEGHQSIIMPQGMPDRGWGPRWAPDRRPGQ